MRISKKDITAFFVLFLGTIVCVRYFYKHMNDEQFVATVDPYSLVVPSPTAIFAINRPPVFEKMILPWRIYARRSQIIPPLFSFL